MCPTLTDLPPDLLLQFAKLLDLPDLLSLIWTCSAIRDVQFEKTLWLDALRRVRHVEMQPLPLPVGIELSVFSQRQLRDAALRTNRLMKNLHSERPRPVAITDFSMEDPWEGTNIFCIPGTHIAVERIRGRITCWDTLSAECVANVEIPGVEIRLGVRCMEMEGKIMFAGYIRNATRHLVAICIDYHDRGHISITHVLSPPLPDIFVPSFINPRLLGWCTPSGHLGCWPIDSNAPIQIDNHVTSGVCCQEFSGRVYLLWRGSIRHDATVHSLPLPSSHVLHAESSANIPAQVTKITLEIPYSFASSQTRLYPGVDEMTSYNPQVPMSDYGIFCVTLRSFKWEGRDLSVVHFWPAHPDGDGLSFGQPCYYEHSETISQMVVGASSTYVLIVVPAGDGYLGLLHFSPMPAPNITFRKLDIGTHSVAEWDHFAFDDSLGLVLAAGRGRNVTIISYA
ncbi:hypothetical protein DFH07DRAFT_799034, partial [Mycena maculata]